MAKSIEEQIATENRRSREHPYVGAYTCLEDARAAAGECDHKTIAVVEALAGIGYALLLIARNVDPDNGA